jgi:CRISPR-associated protein Cas1
MKKSYYLFNPGRISRKDNTLKFTPVDEDGHEGTPKYIPVEGVDNLFAFGSLDANSALYNFLGKEQISVHFFDYFEHYTGSFMPKEYLLAGRMLVAQADAYSKLKKRMVIAQKFVEGAAFNMLKNLRYYNNREKDTSVQIAQIEQLCLSIPLTTDIPMLMGIEGNIRKTYYEAFDVIINDFEMGQRSKQPPSNEVNAMVSFVNSMCYTLCLDMVYHTQLNPTISFLHTPGERRFSLALDLAEIFKPLLADRLIFSLLNKKQIGHNDFDHRVNSCLLKESGRKTVVKAWDERLNETIKHRTLGRSVSYKHLVKLECYKLAKHVLGMEEYKPFKAWW